MKYQNPLNTRAAQYVPPNLCWAALFCFWALAAAPASTKFKTFVDSTLGVMAVTPPTRFARYSGCATRGSFPVYPGYIPNLRPGGGFKPFAGPFFLGALFNPRQMR